ncbi:Aste57867_21651 [Aphanomyces stellatus]|uniref:Aste57867_21651 protein n=1 Tax=Aphanomyces stellatus TaxID=120398 RepID=A0A485LI36_9STRA|nr:hypothetical protein As57867_021582 [Aphanomyces stellatus]VFT98320.1 Aste57867_21651 [Aphanomyces stellatus]
MSNKYRHSFVDPSDRSTAPQRLVPSLSSMTSVLVMGSCWLLLIAAALTSAVQVVQDASSNYYVSRLEKLGADAVGWRTEMGTVRVTNAKFAAGGNTAAWTDTVNSGDVELVGGNVLDSNGNLYVVGSTRGNVTAQTCNAGSFDLFLLKLSPAGTRLWTTQIGTPQHDEARHLLLNAEADGNTYLYVLGVTYGLLDENLHVTNGYRHFGGRDVFLIKFSTQGQKLWSRQFGTSADDFTYGLSLGDDGSVVVAGGGGAGATRVKFLAMYSTTGHLINHVADGGVSILPSQTQLREANATSTAPPTVGMYSVVLNRRPTSSVVVTVRAAPVLTPAGDALTQMQFAPSALVFTPANWNLPQVVAVTAVDDLVCEDVHYASLVHSVSSADPQFGAATPFVLGNSVTFTIADNDVAGIVLSRSNLYAVEGGRTDRYGVVLSSRPWYNVTVTGIAMRPLQTQIAPAQLVFTPANWNTTQWITVTAVNDGLSENEFGGVHAGGSIAHYASSLDCFYNTRQPSCYYLASCLCAGAVARGACTSTQLTSNGCVAGTPLLVCDMDMATSLNVSSARGNGVTTVFLRGGNATNPVAAIPVRFGNSALNPNPPSTTTSFVNAAFETIQVPTRYLQFNPPPIDDGWGGTWTTQTILGMDQPNPNPMSTNVTGLVLQAVPADVVGFVYSFLAVPNGLALATLAQNQGPFLRALCVGVQRLTTQRWAFEAWPPGTADRVLDALFRIFPTLQERQLWNCGLATFAPQQALTVTIFDNDPGVTLSAPVLRVSEGGQVDSYTVVLNAPPSTSGVASNVNFCDPNPNLDFCTTSLPSSFFVSVFPPPATGSSSDTVTVVANSPPQLTVSPQYLTFTDVNWFIPQTFSVAAVDDSVAMGSINVSITHTIFARGATPASYVDASFWFKQELPPSNLSATMPQPIPYNWVPTLVHSPSHRVVQVVKADNDQTGVLVSVPQLNLKETSTQSGIVGETLAGPCIESLSSSPLTGVHTDALLLPQGATLLLKFHLPSLHLDTYSGRVDGAIVVLSRAQFDVVNSSSLNASNAKALAPTVLLRVVMVTNDWTESSVSGGASPPSTLPLPPVVQNVTVTKDSTLNIDVSSFVLAVTSVPASAPPVVSFLITVLDDPANLQMYSRRSLENVPPLLYMATSFPNAAAAQPTAQPGSTHSALGVDGDVTTATDPIATWWQVALPSLVPSGTLAIFLPESVVGGTLDVVVSTAPFDASWDLPTAQAHATAFRRLPILQPVLLWPIQVATQYIRLYTNVSIAEVAFYGPNILLATNDDGWGVRATTPLTESMLTAFSRNAWALASGANVANDNVAAGMPTTQSSIASLASMPSTSIYATTFELNPWWAIDLGAVVAIGDILVTFDRSLNEAAACANPTMPSDLTTISSFSSIRIRLSATPLSATVNAAQETIYTTTFSRCAPLPVPWSPYASGRYVRVEMTGRGALNIRDVQVRRWMSEMSQYLLLELRGSGHLPLALPAFRVLGPNSAALPYRVHSVSTPQTSFNVSQPWGTSCFQATSPTYREWLVLDFFSVQSLQSLQLKFDTATCGASTEPVSAISISLYADPNGPVASPSAPPAGPCACTSSPIGVIQTVLPASCHGSCSTVQCPGCALATFANAETNVVLAASAFRDVAVLIPPTSLPTQDLPLRAPAYRLIVLRDQPLGYWRLEQVNVDSNVAFQGSASIGTSTNWPVRFATVGGGGASSLSLGPVPLARIQWFGASYLNAGAASFTVEFWASLPAAAPTTSPIVLVAYTPPSATSASYEVGVLANQSAYFTLRFGGIATTVVGAPVVVSSTTWTHFVASYDWNAQVQALAANGWNVATQQLTVLQTTPSLTRSGATLAMDWTGTFAIAPAASVNVAHVAWYQRALTHYEVLDHFYYATPARSYATYTVALASQPATVVDIDMVTEDHCYRWGLCNTSAIPSTLRFTPANWNTPQYVMVHGTDDSLAEGLQLISYTHVAYSAATTAPSVLVTTSPYSEAAAGAVTQYYTNLLLNQTVLAPNQTAATSFAALQTAWATQQVQTTNIPTAGYASTAIAPMALVLQDMDAANVVLSSPFLTVSEAGLQAVFEVALATEPKADVSLFFNASTDCYRPCGPRTGDGNACPVVVGPVLGNESKLCNVTVSPTSITFTTETWNVPQAVTVVAVQDHLDEADVHYTSIAPTTRSNDPGYNAMFIESIRVAVQDRDTSNVIVSTSSLALTEANTTQKGTYTIVLTSEPWSEVNVSISNEAAGQCYRLCGYPIDPATCGLPRALAANSITLGTSSVRDAQAVTASMTTTNGIQRISTSTTHINPVYTLTVAGGYVLDVSTLTLVFPANTTYSTTLAYGTTFTLTVNAATAVVALDSFCSASQLQAALITAVGTPASYVVTSVVGRNGAQLVMTHTITYLLGGTAPQLAISIAPFPAVAMLARTVTLQPPTGSLLVGYGSLPSTGLAYSATADQVAAYLKSQTSITDATVTVSMASGPTLTWTITLTAVPMYFATLQIDSSKLVAAAGAAAPLVVTSTCIQQPNTIGGYFQVSYPVNATYTATSVPLRFNASAADMTAALAPFPTLGGVQVSLRSLAAELTTEWTIEFAGNVGPVANFTVQSVNLTGLGSTVVAVFIQQGAALGGTFTLQLGGTFKSIYPTTEVYDLVMMAQTTPPLPFNANASVVQAALLALSLPLAGVQVNRTGGGCDVFGRCRQYTWSISFAQTLGDVPTLVGASQLTGPGAALAVTSLSNGTFLTGSFTLSLALNDTTTGVAYAGTTWPLPVNVTADGMKEALEALPFVTAYRQGDSSFDPAQPNAIPTATKGVRVSRQGPFLDGGYVWLLDWSLNDWLRFTNINITVNTGGVTQDIVPPQVPTQFGSSGPRCAQYPRTVFQFDPTDVFNLRGACVYPLVVAVSPERYLCNATVLTPRPKFDASNWFVPQTIQVVPVHDNLDETTPTTNTTTSTLAHIAYTLDTIYAGLAIPNVSVNVYDIDRAQVVVSRTSLTLAENGSLTDMYFLSLKTEPRAPVQVVVYPWLDWRNTGCYRFQFCNVTLDTTNVTFTPLNWYVPQPVYVRATPDHLDEDDVHYSGLSHGVFSDDAKYNQLSVPTIDVVIYDQDTSAFLVSKSTLVVAELGRSDQYTIVLMSEPFAKVTITPVSNGTAAQGNVIVVPPPLVFTWLNWNIPQTMTVQAVHDWMVDPWPHTTLLSHTVATNDLIYIQQPIGNLTVFTIDVDVAGVTLSQPSINGTEGNVVSYAVSLTSKPWFPVTLSFNASQGCYANYFHTVCNVSMSTTSITFTGETWNVWQVVPVAITADRLDEAPVHSATIAHTLTTNDTWYQTVAAPSMTVVITDMDKSGVVLTSTAANVTVAQGSFNASYGVVLASEPYDVVTVMLDVPGETFIPRASTDGTTAVQEPLVFLTNGTNGSQVVTSVVFAPHNWNVPRTLTLAALTTGSPKPLTMTTSVGHRPVSPDTKYNNGVPPRLFATVLGREDFPPPIPLAASFDGTGVKLVVTFDSTVFHAATMTVDRTQPLDQVTTRYLLPKAGFDCGLVWNRTASTGFLGTGATCLWLDLQTLQMSLGTQATIVPSHRLVLQGCASNYVVQGGCTSPNVLKARDYNVLYTTASIVVTLGPVVVTPNIVLVGPKFMGPCGLLTLDATASSGNANRPFQVQWFGVLSTLVPVTTNGSALLQAAQALYASVAPLCNSTFDPMTNPLSTADQFTTTCALGSLAVKASSSLMWAIDRVNMLSASTYIVGIQLTNFVGQRAVLTQTVQTLSDPVPVVSIAGDTAIVMARTRPLALTAQVASVSAACATAQSSTSKVTFAWSLESSSSPSTAIANTATDPRSFSLAPNTLQAGRTYRFRVDAFYPAQSSLKTSDWANVTITTSALVATIVGGNHKIGAADTLVVNASLSTDPDQLPVPLAFRWTCQDVTPIVVANVTTTPPTNQSCINPTTSLPLDLSAANASILTLLPATYPANKMLNLTVLVVQNCSSSATASCSMTRTAATSVLITTVNGRIPVVRCQASATRVNPGTKILLSSSIGSLYPYTTLWSEDQGDLQLSSAANDTSPAFVFPLTTMQNAIAPNVLTPGKTYVFRLTATDSTGATGYGTVTISVNNPPAPGSFTVAPAMGVAIQDLFTLSCQDWSDQDQPLSYAFYKVDTTAAAGAGALVPLTSAQSLPTTTSRLFLSNTSNANETVTVMAVITDALGGRTNMTASVLVVQPAVTNPVQFWTDTNNGSLASSLNAGNLNDAMTVLLSTSALIQAKQTCNATSCGVHGTCDRVTATCTCAPGYSGSTCTISDDLLNRITGEMLASLSVVTTTINSSPAALTQGVLTIGNIVALSSDGNMNAANVASAASMLQAATANMMTQSHPTDLVASVGGTVLDTSAILLVSDANNNANASTGSQRRRLTSTTIDASTTVMTSLFYMAAMSSLNLLPGEPVAQTDAASVSTFSVVGSALSFQATPVQGASSSVYSVSLTAVADACLGETHYMDAIAWVAPVHASLLPRATPALASTATIAVHTTTALLQAQYQGAALAMAAIEQDDPCMVVQKQKDLNMDETLPLVSVTLTHPPLTLGPRFATDCRSWNATLHGWDNSLCTKNITNSTTTTTTCSCVALPGTGLEVAVVSQEVLTFVPENPPVYRHEPSSAVPAATLAVLLLLYAGGVVWGVKRDKADSEALRLKRLGMLNKATWSELLQHEADRAATAAKARDHHGPSLHRIKQNTAGAFMTTFAPSAATARHDPVEAKEDHTLAAIAAEADTLQRLHEGALFGTFRLAAQHVVLRRSLQAVNAFLLLVSVVFVAVGVDFIYFLGNTTHSVVLVLYGPSVGTGFLGFGLVLAVVALLGLVAATHNTSARLRALYVLCLLLVVVAECGVLGVAYKHLVDVDLFPKATFAYLQTLWRGFSPTIRAEVQTQMGCCGFGDTADAPVLPCPDEAFQDALAPRACFAIVSTAASTLFHHVYTSLIGVVLAQLAALAIANVLVRWEGIRIDNLSDGVRPDKSLFLIFLRCTLPVCCHFGACAMVFAIAAGLDTLLQWDLFELSTVTVFLKLELGLPLVVLGGLYFVLHLVGGWALANVRIPQVKWFAIGHVVLLIAGVCLAIALYTVESNLATYATLQTLLEKRYLGLSTHDKVELETDFVCCGFSATSQGACAAAAFTLNATATPSPLCNTAITAAVQQFATITLYRLVVYLLSQLVLLLFTGIFVSYHASRQRAAAATTLTTTSSPLDEFTDVGSVVVNRVCAQVLVATSLAVAFCGSVLVAIGCDLIFQTNLVSVSAILTAFSYYAGTYILLLGLVMGGASGLGIYAGLSRRKKWLWLLAVVLLGCTVSCLALFAAAYRVQNPVSATAVNATMLSTWTGLTPATKLFVQNALTCCGYTKLPGNVFTLPYMQPTWHDANNVTNVVYTQQCPVGATDGCGPAMLATLTQTATTTLTTSLALCALFFVVFLATSVLYYRQGKKKPVTWRVWVGQTMLILVALGASLALLGLALVSIDLAAGTTIFTSSVVQTVFGGSVGALVLVFVTYALGVTSYGVYGAINKILHVLVIFLGLTAGLVVLAWTSVGVVGHLTTSTSTWQPALDATLDVIWTQLSFDARLFVAMSRQCCGYNPPTPVGALYRYDRAASPDGLSLACPPGLTTGCRVPLLQDAASLLGQLFQLLVAFATLETVVLGTSAFLLHGLVELHRDVWCGIVKKVRWWVAKYRDDVDQHHVALSVVKHFDAKFTRPQRLTCVVCAVATMACVDAAVQAQHGCTRTSSMACAPHSGVALFCLGVLYSSVSLVVQIAFVHAFDHIRHRHDDGDSAKVAERRRKEKVYFREVMQQSLHAIMAKFGHLSMVTSEERFYSWLVAQVDWATFLLSWLRILVAISIGVYMILGKVGLGFYMFGMEVPGSVDFVVVPLLMLASGGGVLLLASFKRQKLHSRATHIGFLVATGISIALVVILALVVFMIVEAIAEPTTPRNWTQRNTGFSVYDTLRALWMADSSGVLRQQWQTSLNCCGLPDFPIRPCPLGPSTLQNVTATKLDGTVVTKSISVVLDVGGCLDKMVAQVQSVSQIVLSILLVMGVMELVVAACTYFLARDILISWDSKMRRLSAPSTSKKEVATDLLPFDVSPVTVAPPQRGRITSALVQTSIDNVSTAVATVLAQTPLSPAACRLQPMSQEKLKLKLRIRYPAWIVHLLYGICGVWTLAFVAGAIVLGLDLGNTAAMPWLGCFFLSLGLHLAVLEPAYVFALVMSKTLHAWWKQTWMAALVGVGKAILHLDQDHRSDDANEAKIILDPFLRIRHNAATIVQRRWMTKLARLRYLVILRVARENAHRVAVETRARTIKAAVASFSREESDAFALLFRDADHAKTGLVSYKVVSHAVYALGVKVPSAVVKQYLVALDPGFFELIDLDYFLYAMSCIRGYHQEKQETQATTDELVVGNSLEGRTQVKKQNALREIKDKRTAISKHLMNKVGKLAAKLRVDTTAEEDAKPTGAYILLNTKKTLRPGSASPPTRTGPTAQQRRDLAEPTSPTEGSAAPVMALALESLNENETKAAETAAPPAKPAGKTGMSVRAVKDMEKAIHQMKLKQKAKK